MCQNVNRYKKVVWVTMLLLQHQISSLLLHAQHAGWKKIIKGSVPSEVTCCSLIPPPPHNQSASVGGTCSTMTTIIMPLFMASRHVNWSSQGAFDLPSVSKLRFQADPEPVVTSRDLVCHETSCNIASWCASCWDRWFCWRPVSRYGSRPVLARYPDWL